GLARWTPANAPAGAYLCRRQVFRGRWIRHGGDYPKYMLKLFCRNAVSVDDGLVDHHFMVVGPTEVLDGGFVEGDRNEEEIATWIARHNRYAVLQAREEESSDRACSVHEAKPFGSPDERTRWQKRVWARLPLHIRAFGYFFYRYVLRLGFLDGKEGF